MYKYDRELKIFPELKKKKFSWAIKYFQKKI